MRKFRSVIFWCHLITAIPAALVILIMSATGVLLTYERQMIAWADTRAYQAAPSPANTERVSVEAILVRLGETESTAPSAITVRANPAAPIEVGFGRERTVFVDPHSGEKRGEGATAVRGFFSTVTDWHRWLGASGEKREFARAITGACNLGFLFLVVSGFYLWWPRNWNPKAIRNVVLFRRGLTSKARDFNWHNVIGFWGAIPLLIVVFSAVVISYPWASDLVYRLAGETPPPARRPTAASPERRRRGERPERNGEAVSPAGLDRLLARAQQQVHGWQSITLRLPDSASDPVTFMIDQGTGGQPQKRGQLVLDRASGEVVRWEPFASNTPGRRIRSLLRFAHTGEVGGVVGQTIAGFASASGAVLVWTGLALTWRRWRAWKGRHSRVAQDAQKRHDDLVSSVRE